MKLTLKNFQEEALQRLAERASWAKSDVKNRGPQTLLLVAPTGSGKTVVAAAWMERIRQGDAERPADPEATFLWITDQPELNEQTKRKFEATSTIFSGSKLVTIDASFDQPTFDVDRVYFLNTQKLGKEKLLVTRGDERTHTLWATINRTAAERPASFWVVIDEAHKGMSQNTREREQAQTLIQKFIVGSKGEIDPVPLIFGLSATPERFADLIAGTSRMNHSPVTVDPEDVRASGLLKEAITLYHPDEQQPSDLTLIKAAAEQVERYRKEWADYSANESAPLVRPILVVQVEDGTKDRPTRTNLEEAIPIIENVLGSLADDEIAHSFQEGHALIFGERNIRYTGAADIQDDRHLRVVLFKRSLTTGWDCPRAEVMMSFRRQVDHTLIAQLVGRMVRTPLARAVWGTEFLNTVCLYLPYYDREALKAVIEYLTRGDPDIALPTKVQLGAELITLERNPKFKRAFEAASSLPTYRIEKVTRQSNIRRLLRLGRLLAWDKLDSGASARFRKRLVEVLEAERKRVASKAEFKQRVAQAAVIDVREVTVGYGEIEIKSETMSRLEAVAQNVEHAFDEAGRKLGGGLHAEYLTSRAARKRAPSVGEIKQELYALAQDERLREQVDKRAGELLAEALEAQKTAIRDLPDERRQLYRQIRRQAAKPESEDWELPHAIEASKNDNKKYEKHLYARSDGKFACKLNKWEDEVIREAIRDAACEGWLRNDPRRPWSFSVPYKKGAEDRPMYPDFLVFRKQGKQVLCDIFEPHALAYEDSVAKAKGLAEFARQHGDEFGRIELIAKLGNSLKRLSLNDIHTRDKILSVATGDELKARFEES